MPHRAVKNEMLPSQLLKHRKFHDQVLTEILKIGIDTKLEHDFSNLSDPLSHEMQKNQNQDEFDESDEFTSLNIIDFL